MEERAHRYQYLLYRFPFLIVSNLFNPFPKRQILDSSKLKELADDNFKFDENGREFHKWVENTGKKRNCSL